MLAVLYHVRRLPAVRSMRSLLVIYNNEYYNQRCLYAKVSPKHFPNSTCDGTNMHALATVGESCVFICDYIHIFTCRPYTYSATVHLKLTGYDELPQDDDAVCSDMSDDVEHCFCW